MRLRFGNYWHGVGEVSVSIARQTIESAMGVPYEIAHTWGVQGRLVGDSTAEIVSQILALERAYATGFKDAALVDNNGLVCHALLNAGSTTGVRVVQPPSYPTGTGAELVTYRDYTLTLTATYPVVGRPLYRAFAESVRLWGGLPNRKMVDVLNGPAVPYVSGKRTAYYASQSGSAVGYYGWPPIPGPLFGSLLLDGPNHPVSFDTPQFREGRATDWPVSWSYQFSSPTPLIGRPNVVPNG